MHRLKVKHMLKGYFEQGCFPELRSLFLQSRFGNKMIIEFIFSTVIIVFIVACKRYLYSYSKCLIMFTFL